MYKCGTQGFKKLCDANEITVKKYSVTSKRNSPDVI